MSLAETQLRSLEDIDVDIQANLKAFNDLHASPATHATKADRDKAIDDLVFLEAQHRDLQDERNRLIRQGIS
jgi:hypothetical protein